MDKIRHIIREVIQKQLKGDSCNCGCHSCDNVGNPGVVLNESITPPKPLSENLQYHVQNKLPLTENTFRYGSEAFIDLWAEARALYLREVIHVNEDDKFFLIETDLGNYGMYEGKKVPLDIPMEEEDLDESKNDNKPLNKPKRGGSKKFYVYVRDKDKIKKVSFGDTSGLSAKISNPKARKAFAARHKCGTGEPKTSARYWSCRIGRYWKQLGGEKNFTGFW